MFSFMATSAHTELGLLPNHGSADKSGKHKLTVATSTSKALSPSPLLLESRRTSKDDSVISPTTPRRPTLQRGLSLQLPKQDLSSPSASKLTTSLMSRVPLSPKLDSSTSLGSSVLPRRSRGLDFSRACTNLHHSTLAESSPDSSPVIGGKGMNIPRKGVQVPDSPMFAGSLWSTMGSEKTVSSSMGSVMVMDSDSTSESDEDMMREEEDMIHMTPQPFRTTFGNVQSPGADAMVYSPAAKSLMNFKRRLRSHVRRKTSSSDSPGPLSPPLLKSVESSNYFGKGSDSRRESLSLGTNQLQISDVDGHDALGLSNHQVVRRAVTRRSNMLPKQKAFARIRAALQEESSPVDSECRREAEVIKQVRESDPSPESQPATAASSPHLGPVTASSEAIEELADIMGQRRKSVSFEQHALRNSGGPEFWNNFDERMRTPPPPFPQRTSSIMSEDVNMDNTSAPSQSQRFPSTSSPSRSSTPQPTEIRKTLGKRRRDDDLDPAMFKRRAVSPGLSLQNSPILPPSPAQRDGGWWQNKAYRESSASSSGNGSLSKRIGLQGMTDTNDGLSNMSIE